MGILFNFLNGVLKVQDFGNFELHSCICISESSEREPFAELCDRCMGMLEGMDEEVRHLSISLLVTICVTGWRSAVGNVSVKRCESDCRSKGH